MTFKRRLFWILTMAALLILTSGCSSTHLRPIEVELARDGTGLLKASGQKINGYKLHGAEHTDFDGWAKLTHQDSLSFWSTKAVDESTLGYDGVEDLTKDFIHISGPIFGITEINTLDVVEPSTGKTVLAIIAAPFAFVAILVVVWLVTTGGDL